MVSQPKKTSEFGFLTEKQAATLDLLANNRTSKEIAFALGISETSVNRRIEVVRSRLGGITRHELARRYREWKAAPGSEKAPVSPPESPATACVETGLHILQLAETGDVGGKQARDGEAAPASFEDPVAMAVDAPWREWKDPSIVPGVLDGENATLTRGIAIVGLLVLIVASLILVLTAAKALADAVS